MKIQFPCRCRPLHAQASAATIAVARTTMRRALLIGASLAWLTGCSDRPARVYLPNYASGAGADAAEAYDANGNDAIEDAELDQVPALRASLEQVDRNGDGRLTADEIDARIQDWRDSRTGLMSVSCRLMLDGAPLDAALVTFEPEPFLGDGLSSASGRTGPDGTAIISLSAEHLPDPKNVGVPCGWYRIRVTSDDSEIPARYNQQTTLGCEVAIDANWVYEDNLRFELTSTLLP